MATESLIVELDARTGKLDAGLRKTEQALDDLDKKTQKSDGSLKKFSGAAGIAAGAVKDLVVTAAALGAAMSAIVIGSAKGRKELELLASQAKIAVSDFQSLAFATKQYGISAEQFADISKDISDKVGEFATAGTGAFQDYADVLGLTKEQAVATATEFQKLTSQQVIARITSDLEKAGASGAQTTFVLESLGNDLSRLAPLFANNSKELKTLTSAYNDINKELEITSGQAEQLSQLSTTFDLLTGSVGNATTKISASLAPALNEFFNSVIEVTPQATQTIVNFINTFRDAESIKSIADVTEQIKIQRDTLYSLTASVEANKRGQAGGRTASENAIGVIQALNERIAEEEERYLELTAQLKVLNDEKERGQKLDAEILSGGKIGTGTDPGTSGITKGFQFGQDDADAGLLAGIIEQQTINEQKLENERSYIEAVNELRLSAQATAEEILARDVEANRLALENKLISLEEFNASQEAASKRYIDTRKKDTKVDGDFDKKRLSETSAYLGAASTLANAFFEDNKALRAALVVADTAAGIARQFSDLPYPAALATSAAIAASGAVQLSAIASSSPGSGGAISAPSNAGTAKPTVQPDFVHETDTLEFTDSTSGGSQTQTIRFASDTGDALVDAIAEALNKGKTDGRF